MRNRFPFPPFRQVWGPRAPLGLKDRPDVFPWEPLSAFSLQSSDRLTNFQEKSRAFPCRLGTGWQTFKKQVTPCPNLAKSVRIPPSTTERDPLPGFLPNTTPAGSIRNPTPGTPGQGCGCREISERHCLFLPVEGLAPLLCRTCQQPKKGHPPP